jgi:hypothetical protein
VATSAIQGEKEAGRQLNERVDYAALSIVEAFPDALHLSEGADAEMRQLRGARIVQIGSTNDLILEGGGLLIDYIPSGRRAVHRAVFAFNERGLWQEADIVLPKTASCPK